MRPRTIVSVLDPSNAVTDVAAAWARSLARWYDADLRFISGRAVPAIAEYSRGVAADVIVVSTRARRGRGYWRAGSFAAALGKASAVPTLAVGGDPPEIDAAASPFRRIVGAIDFSDVSLGALSAAVDLAQQGGGRLRLVHVLTGFPGDTVYAGGDALRLGRAFRASAARITRALHSMVPPDALNWSEIDAVAISGHPGEAIPVEASSGRADLIVLGLPRRSWLEELVAGSTVRGVLRRTRVPVLLVPGPPRLGRVPLAGDDASRLRPVPRAFAPAADLRSR